MKMVPSAFGSIFPIGLESKDQPEHQHSTFPSILSSYLFFCATAIYNRQKLTLLLLLQLKSQRLHSYRQGRDKRKCHLISFRQSSSTSFSPAKIFCYIYYNMVYVSIRAWVGIGIACQRKKTGVKGITNSARELNLERISGFPFLFFSYCSPFSFQF